MKSSLARLLEKYIHEGLTEWVDFIFLVVEISLILFGGWFVSRLIRKIISSIEKSLSLRTNGEDTQRIKTLARVLKYISTVVVVMITVMLMFAGFGISIAPFLATAGVAGIAVGFGAQSLVKDYFTGFVMLIEDQIRQGDVVEIAGKIGTVEEVTLRYIRLRDYEGFVHFVSNSVITVVTNRTRGFAYALIDINVDYDQNIAHVNSIFTKIGQEMRSDPVLKDQILGDIEIAGLENFAESSMTIRARIMVLPLYQQSIRREFQARVKLAFDAENIQIPYPHVVLGKRSKS
jgi:small conductance mechanosensitive channel